MNNADTAPTANLSENSVTSMSPDKLAAPMFLLTLVFLAILAGLIVCLVDIPRVAELAAVETTESVEAVNTSQAPAVSNNQNTLCLLYTSPSPRDGLLSRMPSSA